MLLPKYKESIDKRDNLQENKIKEEEKRMKLQHKTVKVEEIIKLITSTDSIIFDETSIGNIKVKGAADYVTKVDIGVQSYLQKELAQRYPEIGFIGEEQESFQAEAEGSYWILDPIDGTTNLIHHYRMSAVSLGLYESGRITLGIVYNPFNQELYVAVEGQGAYLNGEPIHPSGCESLPDALVSYGSSPYKKEQAHELFALYERIFLNCCDFRRCGSAAMDLCYVACGRQEAYLEQNLKPWDYAAGALILTEAGGKIGTWKQGEELPYLENADIFATNGGIDEALRVLL